VNKKPSGFLGIFKETFNKMLGKDVSVKDTDLRNFGNDKFPSLAEKIILEYLNVSKKISDLEQRKKSQQEQSMWNLWQREWHIFGLTKYSPNIFGLTKFSPHILGFPSLYHSTMIPQY
jgi:hypothetical protein